MKNFYKTIPPKEQAILLLVWTDDMLIPNEKELKLIICNYLELLLPCFLMQ